MVAGDGVHLRGGVKVTPAFLVQPALPVDRSQLAMLKLGVFGKLPALALKVGGLMNVQYAIQRDVVHVLEVNPRASRTVPFVSKAIGVPLAKIAAKVMAGKTQKLEQSLLQLEKGRFRSLLFEAVAAAYEKAKRL